MRVEESIQISRPRDEVWEYVANPANDPEWCPKVKAVEPRGAQSWDVTHKPVPLANPPERLRIREEDDASVFELRPDIQAQMRSLKSALER